VTTLFFLILIFPKFQNTGLIHSRPRKQTAVKIVTLDEYIE